MAKAKTLPPRKPRGEAPSVTIGNLEWQVQTLTKRAEDLVTTRDDAFREMSRLGQEVGTLRNDVARETAFRKADVSRLEECQARLASTEQRFEGYRQAIEDICRS